MENLRREELRKRNLQKARDPKKDVKDFFMFFWGGGDSDEEIRARVLQLKAMGATSTERDLKALDSLLNKEEPGIDFVDLVTGIANVPLDVPNEENARAWLREKSMWMRQILSSDGS